jgi:hypothetical protein
MFYGKYYNKKKYKNENIKVTIEGHGHKIETTRTIRKGHGIKFLQQMKKIKDNFIKNTFDPIDWEHASKNMPLTVTINPLDDAKPEN